MKTLGGRPAASSPLPAAARDEANQACERLRRAGLRLFADQGYAKTSIRQIATEAQANIAAVSYYFGDKAGLYRAVFRSSPSAPACAGRPMANSLSGLFERFLAPLKQGKQVRLWVKMYRREMLEPTGLWHEKIEQDMRPMHAWLVQLLCERLGLPAADDDVHRLAISIAGLAVHLFIGCEAIDALAPQLSAGPDSVDLWRERLVVYAEAMIDAERQRRRLPVLPVLPAPPVPATPTSEHPAKAAPKPRRPPKAPA